MKTKKRNKKLTLNKNTIANLMTTDLQKIRGGGLTIKSCDTCDCPTMPTGCQETCNPAVCPSLEVMCG